MLICHFNYRLVCRYWANASEIARKMAIHTQIQRKISFQKHEEAFEQNKISWEKTTEAQALFQQMKAYETDEKVYKRQKTRLESGGQRRFFRRSFIELFTTSKIGLGINTAGQGKRNSTEQSSFRDSLIKAYDSKNSEDYLWDPIIKDYVTQRDAIAAHLFAFRHGQATMDAIFGVMNPPELFQPLNGLIISSTVEEHFDKGFFAIVPRLPENPLNKETIAWTKSNPKEYKIRILNFDYPAIDTTVHPSQKNLTWRKLDGADVQFLNNFRPRARYLYFHFCLQVLRLTWSHQQKNAITLKKELGKVFWETQDKYLPKNMLKAFVEELGHEYSPLLKRAVEEENDIDVKADDADETLLQVALDQVKASGRNDNSSEDENEDEDDEKSTPYRP